MVKKMPACFACFVALALTAVAVGHRQEEVLEGAIVACSANGGSLTLVSATGAGGHCKGKRELFIAEGKKTEMCGAVLQAEAASSLRLRL